MISQPKEEFTIQFLLSLFNKIESTYLGDDITNEDDQNKHFEWCCEDIVSFYNNLGINLNIQTIKENLSELYNFHFYSKSKTSVVSDFMSKMETIATNKNEHTNRELSYFYNSLFTF